MEIVSRPKLELLKRALECYSNEYMEDIPGTDKYVPPYAIDQDKKELPGLLEAIDLQLKHIKLIEDDV